MGYRNPYATNYVLFVGNCDFSYALHKLRMQGYNVFLVRPPQTSQLLRVTAKIIWPWNSLTRMRELELLFPKNLT